MKSEPQVLVPLAFGVEEIEAVTIIDILRRAGLSVRVSSLSERQIIGANGIGLIADSEFEDEDVLNYDAIVLPGGSQDFASHTKLGEAVKHFAREGKICAAICASPALVLAHLGLLSKVKATSYPSFKQHIPNYVDDKVVVDGNIITSQGPGTALAFALKLAEILAGPKKAEQVKNAVLA